MKKLAVMVLTIFTCGAAYALPLGNPTEATLFLNGLCWDGPSCDPCNPCYSWCDAFSMRIGFYGDYVYNRHMKIEDDVLLGQDIQTTSLFTNAGYLVLNICDRIDLFTTLGATQLEITTDQISWANIIEISANSVLGFTTAFSWSAGARATLWECDCFGVGIEGQYFQTTPHVDYFSNRGTGGLINYFNGFRAKYSEWQVGLGASYRFATSCPTIAFVPYAGVKWARSRLELGDAIFRDEAFRFHDLKSEKRWGYAVGISITLCDLIGVNVEGRFADETALYVNGQVRF